MNGKSLAEHILSLSKEEQDLPVTHFVSNHSGEESHISIVEKDGQTSLYIGNMIPWNPEQHKIIKKII